MKSESKNSVLVELEFLVLGIISLLSLWSKIRDDVGAAIEDSIEKLRDEEAEILADLCEFLDETKNKLEKIARKGAKLLV